MKPYVNPLKTSGAAYSLNDCWRKIMADDLEAVNLLYAKTETKAEAEAPATTFAPSSAERREAVMTRLWQRMGEIFGNQFELNFGRPGGSTYYTWLEALAQYSEQQLRNGLEQCRQWDSGFVPHLGQFAKLCLTKQRIGPNFTEERLARGKCIAGVLEHLGKRAHTEAAKAELERILRIVAGEEVETFAESYRKLDLQLRWGPLAR
jgi:hypothetical protein